MVNESIFFTHIALLIFFIAVSLRFGRGGLVAISVVQVVLANLFVTKQITLFSLNVTPTDAYILGSLLTSNLLQEYYGKEEANNLVKINLLVFVFTAFMALVQLFYLPSPQDTMYPHFYQILSHSPRIFIASLIAFFLTQKLDVELFGFLRKRFSLKIAMVTCLMFTQAFDTLVFSLLALYKVVSPLFPMMALSYLIKMITLACMVPLSTFIKKKRAHEV